MNKETLGTKEGLTVHVLFRFSSKTGKVDTTMTGLGSALMRLWAMQNTTKTKRTMIMNRDTGEVVFMVDGKTEKIKTERDGLGTCEDYGISLEALQAVTDDRFD